MLVQYKKLSIKHLILAEIISLIHNIHKYGIYHGDISLSNIMVKSFGESYSLDEDISYHEMKYKFYLIDFEMSGKSNNIDFMKQDWKYLKESIYDLSNDFYSKEFLNIYETIKIY